MVRNRGESPGPTSEETEQHRAGRPPLSGRRTPPRSQPGPAQPKRTRLGSFSSLEFIDHLVHLIRRLYHLGVGLVGALAHDHVDELLDHADIGALDIPLRQRAETLLAARIANGRVTGSIGLQEEILPNGAQAGGLLKIR